MYDAPNEEKSRRVEQGLHTPLWGKKDGVLDRELYEYFQRANSPDPNEARQAVYMVVNEGGHTSDAITRVRAVFIDADVESGKGRLLSEVNWHQPPSLIVRRGNNYHAYWLVRDFPLESFTEVQRRLANYYGSDPAVSDLPRIMRVPGFMHLKKLDRGGHRVELIDPTPMATGEMCAPVLDLCGLIYSYAGLTCDLPVLAGQEQLHRAADKPTDSYGPMLIDEARHILSFIEPTYDGEEGGAGYNDWGGRVRALLSDPEHVPLTNTANELLGMNAPEREVLVRDWCNKTLWNQRTGETGEPATWISWEHVKAEISREPARGGKRLIGWGTFIRDARKTPGYVRYERAKLPLIRQVAGQMHLVVQQLDEALAQAKSAKYPHEPAVYWQPGRIVVVENETAEFTAGKQFPKITTVTVPLLRVLAPRYARIEKYLQQSGWVPGDLREDVARAYLASGGDACPSLRGVLEAPTILSDGTVLQTPGFHEERGLLLRLAHPFPTIPDRPSRAQAESALQQLRHPFRAVEFESGKGTGIDADVVVAAILTALARPSLRIAPMFLLSASQPSSGKTLVAQAISHVKSGHGGAVITVSSSEEETEKRLAAALMAGCQVIILDNCSRPIGGDFLCVILTAPVCHPRRLGLSENVCCSTSTLIIATGNNMVANGDVAGRCVFSYNKPATEFPHKRTFDFDLIQEIEQKRPALVTAGLTLMRAYVAAGCPSLDGVKPSRFPDWDKFVRLPIIWAGGQDIQPAMDKVLGEDPKRAMLGGLLQAWYAVYGDQEKVLADVIAELELESPHGTGLSAERQHLRHAIKEAVPSKTPTRDTNQFGYWLRGKQSVPVGGLEFSRGQTTKLGRLWRVVQSKL